MSYNERDLVCFAEGQSDANPQALSSLLQEFARNPDLRRRVLELRRDLYRVDSQIPEIKLRAEGLLEVNRLAESWIKVRVERRLKLERLLLGRENWVLVLTAALALAAVVALSSYS